MKKLSILFLFFTLCLFACMVPPASEENSIEKTGTVIEVSEGSSFDVVLTFQNDDSNYYINRGLENGLTLDGLKEKVLNKEVTVKYPKMNVDIGTYHLYEVKVGEVLIYSEMPEQT